MAERVLHYARVGDFYEFLGADAVAAFKAVTDLSLSRRDGVPMTGFPARYAPQYLSRLIAAGFSLQELPTLAALKAAAEGADGV